jgi:hypothetical protein
MRACPSPTKVNGGPISTEFMTSIRRDLDALKWPEGTSRLGLDSVLVAADRREILESPVAMRV